MNKATRQPAKPSTCTAAKFITEDKKQSNKQSKGKKETKETKERKEVTLKQETKEANRVASLPKAIELLCVHQLANKFISGSILQVSHSRSRSCAHSPACAKPKRQNGALHLLLATVRQ